MSKAPQANHRRLIVELCHGAADLRTLHAVAECAASLELELHGLFVEDDALLALAELPFAREIRLPTHQWQKLEADQIAAELRHAAGTAQHLLHEAAAALGVPNAFEVRRGDPAEMLTETASESDVIVIAAPCVGSRLTPTLSRLSGAAHGSPASVLLLPGEFASRNGPIVALLANPEDASLALAARAAINTKARLLMLLPEGDAAMAEDALQRAITLGVPRARITRRMLSGLQAEDVLHALGHVRERLLVMTRDATPASDPAGAARIAADRAAPVLLVEDAAIRSGSARRSTT